MLVRSLRAWKAPAGADRPGTPQAKAPRPKPGSADEYVTRFEEEVKKRS
jgi:hypothetical protein